MSNFFQMKSLSSTNSFINNQNNIQQIPSNNNFNQKFNLDKSNNLGKKNKQDNPEIDLSEFDKIGLEDKGINNNNLTKIIHSINLNYPKNFDKIIDDTFLNENLNFSDFEKNIFNEINHSLNPFFSVYSDINKKLYILISIKSNNDKNLEYFLFVFEKNNFLKKLKLIFKDNHQRNLQNSNFLIEKMILHQKNQNQLCLFSSSKIAMISNLNIITEKNHLEIKSILDIEDYIGENNNYNNDNKSNNYFKKFSYWDFDNHFGIFSSKNILDIFYFNEHSIEQIATINLAKIQDYYNQQNIIDFGFGRANNATIWEAFSIFFLTSTGRVFYCCPIFPKIINCDYLMSFNKMKTFLNISSNFENQKNKNTDLNDSMNSSNKSINQINLNYDVGNENIIANFIKLQKLKKEVISKTQNPTNNSNLIEINEYLKYFNEEKNIFFKELSIIDKRKNSDKIYFSKDLLDFLENKNDKDKNKGQFTQIKILSTYPLSFIRVYQQESIDVILEYDQIKPIRKEDFENNRKISAFLIESKNFKINFENKNNIQKKLEIFENPIKNTQMIINILSDVYIINLNYLSEISKKFLYGNDDKDKSTHYGSNTVNLNTSSDVISYIKINYSKIQNLKTKKFSYFGINFINLIDKNSPYTNTSIILLGFDIKNRLFVKEYKAFKNFNEINTENKLNEIKNTNLSQFIQESKNKEVEKLTIKLLNKNKMNTLSINLENYQIFNQK